MAGNKLNDLMNEGMHIPTGHSISYVTAYFEDMMCNKLIAARLGVGLSSFVQYTKVLCTSRHWKDYIQNNFANASHIIVQTEEDAGTILHRDNEYYLSYKFSANSTKITVSGNSALGESIIQNIETTFEKMTSYIQWVYNDKGDYIYTPLDTSALPIKEMYPFLDGRSLESYYQSFLESRANILLLIGPPGTGKTTFIKGMLNYADTSAVVTYDQNLLQSDSVFADFLEDRDASILVLEDSDVLLSSRSSGNNAMHKLLNLGDGLVSARNKKIIFSTNLPSTRDIDNALLRKGRCFDVCQFSLLNEDQSTKLASAMDIPFVPAKEFYTLADILNPDDNGGNIPSSMGFL